MKYSKRSLQQNPYLSAYYNYMYKGKWYYVSLQDLQDILPVDWKLLTLFCFVFGFIAGSCLSSLYIVLGMPYRARAAKAAPNISENPSPQYKIRYSNLQYKPPKQGALKPLIYRAGGTTLDFSLQKPRSCYYGTRSSHLHPNTDKHCLFKRGIRNLFYHHQPHKQRTSTYNRQLLGSSDPPMLCIERYRLFSDEQVNGTDVDEAFTPDVRKGCTRIYNYTGLSAGCWDLDHMNPPAVHNNWNKAEIEKLKYTILKIDCSNNMATTNDSADLKGFNL